MPFEKLEDVKNIPQEEEKLIEFWRENKIFEKSLKIREGKPRFVFYEGPPTANGKPGVHHGLSRIYKDTVLRFKSLTGYYVPRRGGWDTQGLPVEIEVEKMLGIHTKREIEEFGIEKFNQLCKESVMKYVDDWEKMTERIGFWLDMKNAYKTYENYYLETIWWILKEVFNKGLLYEGHKVVPYCPRCGTTLSSHEVALGYKKVKDPSIYVFFPVVDERFPDTNLLVWTTTPWTLPSNVAAAVNPEFTYILVEFDGKKVILEKTRAHAILGHEGVDYKLIDEFKGRDLEGIKYEPPFRYIELNNEDEGKAFRVVLADFVTNEDGSGIVHIAPAFGEDDLNVGKAYNLPMIQLVDLEGKLIEGPYKGKFVKDADPLLIEDLKKRGLLFKKELYEHDYPFCWRCGTPLLYYAKGSWFIKMSALREELVKNNETVNWFPESIKYGRFGNWLANINDWALSRERYWGTPLNIWKCENCGHVESIGSIKELQEKAIEEVPDDIELHKPYVDRIHLKCPKCGSTMSRVPEVIDVWFDSGAMPFAQLHYPFENVLEFEQNFPADFITEAIDQTRGWFYSLLAISTLVKGVAPYKTVMCLELILDEKGQKMSKSKGNVIDPWTILNVQGADAFRWAIYTASPPWLPRRFGPNVVNDAMKEFIIPLRNVYSFFSMYANLDKFNPRDVKYVPVNERHILDKWIIARVEEINKEVWDRFDKFEITPLTKDIQKFVDDLSNWYVRRSRRRFWKSENDEDKISAYLTLYEVLVKLSYILAPFTPFLSESLYQRLVRTIYPEMPESVHLTDYPKPNETLIDQNLIENMELVIEITSMGRSLRKDSKIKVRQPLSKLVVVLNSDVHKEFVIENIPVIAEELNVKEIVLDNSIELYGEVNLKPNLPVLGQTYGNKLPKIVQNLSDQKVINALLKEGFAQIEVDNEPLRLTMGDVFVEVKGKNNYIGAFENGNFVFLDTTLTDDLIKEGISREIIHTIQNMRKEANYDIADRIITAISPKDDIIKEFEDYIKEETLSTEIKEDLEEFDISNSLEANEKTYTIKLKKI
ncbi:isoleucine--tRNA ligase [Caldisericum sp. AR60]|uniref:isoleucine--tRNA ligase n=1 Tax=Caldisericum sp. AR60 TaxID=3397852 RepID=UPI0039FD69B7